MQDDDLFADDAIKVLKRRNLGLTTRQKLALQVELVKLQNWVKESGQRVVVLCEGRDEFELRIPVEGGDTVLMRNEEIVAAAERRGARARAEGAQDQRGARAAATGERTPSSMARYWGIQMRSKVVRKRSLDSWLISRMVCCSRTTDSATSARCSLRKVWRSSCSSSSCRIGMGGYGTRTCRPSGPRKTWVVPSAAGWAARKASSHTACRAHRRRRKPAGRWSSRWWPGCC